jgi:hypothetical protein
VVYTGDSFGTGLEHGYLITPDIYLSNNDTGSIMSNSLNYIPSPENTKTFYAQHRNDWSTVDKVQISNIKIDARLFSYPNKVDLSEVETIIENFDEDRWEPIQVNEDYYLLDGQHRLKVAQRMKLNYIDVIVQHVANYSFYYGKAVKRIEEIEV